MCSYSSSSGEKRGFSCINWENRIAGASEMFVGASSGEATLGVRFSRNIRPPPPPQKKKIKKYTHI